MDDFYAHDAITSPSAFAQWTAEAGEDVAAVIDLGCGNGRDAVYFADRGLSVTAVDSSSYAAAAAHALVGDRQGIDVVEGDVLEHGRLAALRNRVQDGAVLFYARFLLNGLTESEEQRFLEELGGAAVPGDFVALEHRTDLDATLKKARFRSFRRFIPAADTLQQLQGLGFEILDRSPGPAWPSSNARIQRS